MTEAELAGMKERLKRGSPLDCAESSALIAEVEEARAAANYAEGLTSTAIKEREAAEAEAARTMNACTHAEAELKEAEAEVERLRAALRKVAISKHVRLTYNNGTAPNGGSCKLCKSEWDEGKPESHHVDCFLVVKP